MKKLRFVFPALLLIAGMVFLGCGDNGGGDDNGGGPGGGGAITYTVVADGEEAMVTSTKLTFTFDADVAALTADDITVTVVTKGALTGSGKAWELAISGIAEEGNIKVKIAKDGIEDKEKTVAVYKAVVLDVTIDATAGTAVHNDFVITKSNASAHGPFDGEEEDGVFTITTKGAIRYEYPVASNFDYRDYDFVEVEFTATPSSGDYQSVIKQYDTAVDQYLLTSAGLPGTNNFTNSTASPFKLDLRYGNGGFAIQKWGDSIGITVEITKITFSKGTRYNITFDTDAEGVTVPEDAPTYVVLTTRVGPLPSLVRSGYIFQGWVTGNPETAVTETTVVNNTFANAVLKATWKQAVVQAAQTVTFTYPSGNIVPRGNTADLPDIELVGSGSGNGYQITTHNNSYGSSWAYFTYEFTNNANLSDFNKVTFTYQGVSGDINGKPRVYMIVRETSAIGPGTSGYFGLENADSACSSDDAIDGTAPISITMTIDQGKAAAFDGKTIGFIVGLHADDYVMKISNVVFSQDN